MSGRLFVGIDTSNYTTSIAVADEEGRVLQNGKTPLPVAEGERGLRQSDAVFHHVRNLIDAAPALRTVLDGAGRPPIAAVGVSDVPRDAEGSYMPCFLSGRAAAETAGALLGVPVFCFSHQAGHVMAALHSAGAMSLAGREFAAFHVSGGTTDVLLVRPTAERVFDAEKIGGARDVHAGQIIDRCGVYMGLCFPAGPEMERLAASWAGKLPHAAVSVDGTECNLSGLENLAKRLYDRTGDRALCAAFILDFIGRTLAAMRGGVRRRWGGVPILYAGGVMSCRLLAAMLAEDNAYFADAPYSSDNAAGTALLARRRLLGEEGRV